MVLLCLCVTGNLWYAATTVVVVPGGGVEFRPAQEEEDVANHRQPTSTGTSSSYSSTNDAAAWLNFTDFNYVRNHVYAAAWWQSVDRFRQVMEWIDTMPNGNFSAAFIKLEGACHLPVEYETADVRLPRDWLALGVEHLSKWWKMTRYQKHATAFDTISQRLVEYLTPQEQPGAHTLGGAVAENPWHSTLAVVAYSPLVGPRAPTRAHILDSLVTSATLTSLVRQGCQRIVLVFDQSDANTIQHLIWPGIVTWLRMSEQQIIGAPSKITTASTTPIHRQGRKGWKMILEDMLSTLVWHSNATMSPVRIHDTDIVPIPVDSRVKDPRGKWQKRLPRQALLTVHSALRKHHPSSSPDVLGSKPFRYIYYTEQDSILHASFTTHNHVLFQQSLDQGKLLIPHRWQPMPHETDFAWVLEENDDNDNNDLPETFFVPNISPWDHVHALNVNDNTHLWYCCDGGLHSTTNFVEHPPPCQDYWYLCGLGVHADEEVTAQHRLAHLYNFSFIRLSQGTGLTLLAASEHARKCHPSHLPC